MYQICHLITNQRKFFLLCVSVLLLIVVVMASETNKEEPKWKPNTKVCKIRYHRAKKIFEDSPSSKSLIKVLQALQLYKSALLKDCLKTVVMGLPDPVIFKMQLDSRCKKTLVKIKSHNPQGLDSDTKKELTNLMSRHQLKDFVLDLQCFPVRLQRKVYSLVTPQQLTRLADHTLLLTRVYGTNSIKGQLFWTAELMDSETKKRIIRYIPETWIHAHEFLVNPVYEVEQQIGSAILPNGRKVTLVRWRGFPDIDFY